MGILRGSKPLNSWKPYRYTMSQVTEVRESGVEILAEEIDGELQEEADGALFRTEEPVTITVGQIAGNDVEVTSEYFIAASAEGEREVSPMEAMMGNIDPEDDDVTETEEGLLVEYDESSVFISNEDGAFDENGGLLRVEGGDIDDAVSQFEDDHL